MRYLRQRAFGLAREYFFGLYVIWTVTALFYIPLVVICVALIGTYLRSTIIWPVVALLHLSSEIIPVARTVLYLRSTIIWYLVPVPTATL